MGSLMQKFLKKATPLRIISSLNNLQSPKPTPFNLFDQSTDVQNKTEHCRLALSFMDSNSREFSKSSNFFPSLPNFPFGYCPNPIYSTGFDRMEVSEVEQLESDARKIWADSVKKKRKKKMNKHKYKKLRKRLRRKT
ncbi:hypothetical protein Nepgr_003048 [Nepenthes gracilis]|uniref:Small ribosomal subunit protein mS38 n=1 Tax=Nepenthes gracilis TaxID=150966 RepID=A0AAD3RYT3_NEPGR|nr:hypothetical protein Nepgr_003048 [Nepenthes gracilis]